MADARIREKRGASLRLSAYRLVEIVESNRVRFISPAVLRILSVPSPTVGRDRGSSEAARLGFISA